MANEQNLRPFPKGNPGGGRPKGSVSLVKILEKMLDKKIYIADPFSKEKVIDPVTGKEIKPKVEKKVAEAVVLRWLGKALTGDMPAIKEVLERTDGKVNQQITGKDGDAIKHEHDVKVQLANSEIEDRINHLLKAE